MYLFGIHMLSFSPNEHWPENITECVWKGYFPFMFYKLA